MLFVFGLIGGIVGFRLAGLSGFAFGASIGVLIGWVNHLSGRLAALEKGEATTGGIEVSDRTPPVAEPISQQEESTGAPGPLEPEKLPEPPRPAREAPADALQGEKRKGAGAADRTSSPAIGATESMKAWFSSGNVPVKVGVVLCLFGMAFFIREAIDRQLLDLPIELRLGSVAVFGLGLLVVGWRLRWRRRGYALSLQGGGIAVLYLTAYTAFAMYGLLPAAAAFAFLLIVTVAGGVLAVLQDSRALAVLGIVGGFMAPVLASSGSSDHVLLFSYYAILNLAVVGVAWFKAWRSLNLLGFFFTFGIGSLWGYQGYQPEHFATTEPFLILFVVMYTLIPVFFSHRQDAPNLRGLVDGTLVFGTPIVGFGLQTSLVGDIEYGLAISAIALAGLYVSIATFIFHRAKDLRVMMEAFLGLGIVFLAIAVPLALDAQWTSVAWALQGAAMIWLSCRQQRRLALLGGLVLQLLAGATFFVQPGTYPADTLPLLNSLFLGAGLIALAGWSSGWWLDRSENPAFMKQVLAPIKWLLLGWSTAWWLWAGFTEIERLFATQEVLAAGLVFVAVTAAAAGLAAGRLDWPNLNSVGLVLLPAMVIALLMSMADRSHPFASYGWLAWPFAVAVHYALLRFREDQFSRLIPALHTGAYWIVAGLIALEAQWLVDQWTNGIWPLTAAIAAVAAFLLGTLRGRKALPWPLGDHWSAYSGACAGGVALAVTAAVLASNLVSSGDAAPLPYLPVLNPLTLASLFSLFVVWRWELEAEWWRYGDRYRFPIVAVVGLYLLTMAVARAVHHWVGVPFDVEALSESVVLQSSLSIAWSVTGLLGMVLGARTRRREIWVGGAVLMTVVVIKLFLVELDNTGTVGRVVSFLGVGVLLLIVGYYSPVPPRLDAEAETAR